MPAHLHYLEYEDNNPVGKYTMSGHWTLRKESFHHSSFDHSLHSAPLSYGTIQLRNLRSEGDRSEYDLTGSGKWNVKIDVSGFTLVSALQPVSLKLDVPGFPATLVYALQPPSIKLQVELKNGIPDYQIERDGKWNVEKGLAAFTAAPLFDFGDWVPASIDSDGTTKQLLQLFLGLESTDCYDATNDKAHIGNMGSTDGMDDTDGNNLSTSGEWVEMFGSDFATMSDGELCDMNDSDDMRSVVSVGTSDLLFGIESKKEVEAVAESGRLEKGFDLVQYHVPRSKLRVGVNLQKLASDHQ